MAFNIDYLARVSTSANIGALKVWTYNATSTGTDEAIATVVASGYFDAAQQVLTSGSEVGLLAVGDVFHIHGNDSNGMYAVTSITTNVALETYAAVSSIDTSQLAAGAITNAKVDAAAAIAFSKLEVMTSGNVLVGSASNVATEVTMSGDVAIIASGATTIQAGAVDSSMLNANMLRYAVVSITASDFNGMYVTPIELVAAGGADTMLVLESCQLLMTYGSAQFAAGGVTHIQYDSTGNGAGVIASTTQAASDFADAVSTANGFNQGIVKQPFSTCVNKNLSLSNVTQAFTTGDSTFEAHIWYRQVPTV